jgi:hypothetical protein
MEQRTETAADCLDIRDMGTSTPSKQVTWKSKLLARTLILTPVRLTGLNSSVLFFLIFFKMADFA